MRIALQTGAGRGAVELAGRQGEIRVADLLDHLISYELTPSLVIPGRAVASWRQGKPRITLEDTKHTTHVQRLLAAVLLMPTPRREVKKLHGENLMREGSYAMTAIKVDVGKLLTNAVVLRPTELLLSNADDLHLHVDFATRMARVVKLWDAAREQDSDLAHLVIAMEAAVVRSDPDYKEIEFCAAAIRAFLNTVADVLPLAEQALGLAQPRRSMSLVRSVLPQQADFGVDDDLSPHEALVQRVRKWRRQAVRGSAGISFRRAVRDSYGHQCLFSGQRLPKTDVTYSAGVDAAHILPWSTHDIDSVRNGLCLNKQCHWAFDEGILQLNYDAGANRYLVKVPDAIRAAANKAAFDLDYFDSLTGPVSESRLPRERTLWPSPQCIEEYNRIMAA